MSSSEKQLLTRIKKNEKISKPIFDLLYKKEKLEFKDAEFLYSIALSLIDEYEKNIKLGKNKKLFIEYAYFIIFKTSIKLEQYGALYDFTVNFGYYPVARKILELGLISNISINHILSNLEMDEYSSDNSSILEIIKSRLSFSPFSNFESRSPISITYQLFLLLLL